jgi:tetratricopeptide (TPR) repeat protein
MFQDHPTTDDWEGFLRDASPAGRAARNALILRHLLASCRICRGRLEAMGWSMDRLERLVYLPGGKLAGGSGASSPRQSHYNYDRAFAQAESTVDEFLTTAPPPAEPVDQILEQLDRMSREAQLALVDDGRRFAVPQLIEKLLDRSHSVRYEDPEAMLHWADLARALASRSTPDALGSSTRLANLQARAWGQYGNALRVAGRLPEAENALLTAQRYLEAGTKDPVLRASLREHAASLYIFQRRFDDAVSAMTEAVKIYRQLGETHSLARVLIRSSLALMYAGSTEAAVDLLNEAIPLIDHETDPHLLLAACHNLMRCYIDLDQPEWALSIYAETRDLYKEFGDSLILLRANWQEGQLLRDLGHLRAAEAALLRARQGFMDRNLMYEVAVVCLDLAALYVKLGSAEDLEETVTTALPIFRSLGVDREALASLLQLQQFASQEQQAMELIRFLNARIEPLARHGLAK